jgi:hypothetical protein
MARTWCHLPHFDSGLLVHDVRDRKDEEFRFKNRIAGVGYCRDSASNRKCQFYHLQRSFQNIAITTLKNTAEGDAHGLVNFRPESHVTVPAVSRGGMTCPLQPLHG